MRQRPVARWRAASAKRTSCHLVMADLIRAGVYRGLCYFTNAAADSGHSDKMLRNCHNKPFIIKELQHDELEFYF